MRPLIIAHRGDHTSAPQNSMEAFEAAINLGVDFIEFDVRRTKDGAYIIMHDGEIAGVPVGSLTFGEIIDITRSTPLLLEDVLESCGGRIGLDIDLKEDGYVSDILKAVGRYNIEQVIYTSFIDDALREVRLLQPSATTGLIVESLPSFDAVHDELSFVARMEECGSNLIVPRRDIAKSFAVQKCNKNGMLSMVWTVNSDDELEQFIMMPEVYAIITDMPKRALAIRNGLR